MIPAPRISLPLHPIRHPLKDTGATRRNSFQAGRRAGGHHLACGEGLEGAFDEQGHRVVGGPGGVAADERCKRSNFLDRNGPLFLELD